MGKYTDIENLIENAISIKNKYMLHLYKGAVYETGEGAPPKRGILKRVSSIFHVSPARPRPFQTYLRIPIKMGTTCFRYNYLEARKRGPSELWNSHERRSSGIYSGAPPSYRYALRAKPPSNIGNGNPSARYLDVPNEIYNGCPISRIYPKM